VSIDELGRAAAAELHRRAASRVDPTVKLKQLRRMKRTRTAASALAVVGACAAVVVSFLVIDDRPATPAATALNGHWFIATIDGSTVTDPAIDLHIASGHLLGGDGCNAISGSVRVAGNQLSVPDLAVAGADVPECVTAYATAIERVLSGTVTWSVERGLLTLSRPGVGRLVYSGKPGETPTARVPAALADATWELTELDTSFGTFTSGYLTHTKVRIDRAGRITVAHRCFVNAGTVQIQGAILDIRNVRLRNSLRCPTTPNQAAEQRTDAIIDNALFGSTTWSIADGRLQIKAVGGETTTLLFRDA
jgi:heat shock protein HslJ